ncbi:ATP-grasp domain-containing protein [Pseudoxanthomonas dokdonensis]|uniref:ATP-grasp domain-containing protein n=1 Tax=Pseudoxanthomonas dokdonensis TaxID=344882 RepID=A0A0R0CJZ2_9GAMM|nr:hypothetical protein [Pseudoxanthomonas dokdonensis]KRG69622.1 hypothetical protein ABB29_09125 [Pseudoxanthomonas dokdonensis]
MPTLAIATAIAATGHDPDLPPLLAACQALGIPTRALAWDDPTISWRGFDAVLLRSTWDYTRRLPEFLAWCDQIQQHCLLLNPLAVLRWNSDKHYLADLAAMGVPVISSRFVEPDEAALPVLEAWLATQPAGEFVVKPCIGAGAEDAVRYSPGQLFAASNHLAGLLDQQRSALLQPYLASVDLQGETALVYLGGEFSHALRKEARLGQVDHPLPERIALSNASPVQRSLAEHALAAASRLLQLEEPLAYARVDLLEASDGTPRLLELELIEPSLFLDHAGAAAHALARQLAARLAASAAVRTRTACA